MGFPLSPGSAGMKAMCLKAGVGRALSGGGSPPSGQAASLSGRDAASAQVRQSITVLWVRLEACFHLQRSLKSWSGGASLMEVQGHRSGAHPSSGRNLNR